MSIGVLAALALTAAACGDDDEEEAADSAQAQELAAPLVIQADTVRGSANVPEEERAGSVCVLQSRYARNSEVVWRATVIDPVTGEELDDNALASLTVELADGETFEMEYGDHPRENPTDSFWAAAWDVPADYPTGTLEYTIMAEANDGRTAQYEPFMVESSELTITEEVLTPIEETEG